MKIGPNQPCPCGSGSKFKKCCLPLHRGRPAPTPEALMRSRYAAYAAGEVGYILDTTHPEGPQYRADREAWEADVRDFCRSTAFEGLEVLEAGEDGTSGHVHFRVRLTQGGRDAGFGEASTFYQEDGRWLYHSGEPLGR